MDTKYSNVISFLQDEFKIGFEPLEDHTSENAEVKATTWTQFGSSYISLFFKEHGFIVSLGIELYHDQEDEYNLDSFFEYNFDHQKLKDFILDNTYVTMRQHLEKQKKEQVHTEPETDFAYLNSQV